MESIRSFEVPQGCIGIWWLGQSGYVFKTPLGTLAGIDLYLTNSCAALRTDVNLARQVPVLITPEELAVDLFVVTHNHLDHTDPETIRRLERKGQMRFLGPHPSCEIFRAEGVSESQITPAWPDCEVRFRDLVIRGTFALPTDDTDLNHMGYVFGTDSGPRVWLTGDTDWSDLLPSAARHSPDLMIVCINGGFNNLSHWEAAELASRVKPAAAIPSHYDLFPDNSIDPKQFRAALKLRAPEVQYIEMVHGEPLVYER